MIAKKPKLSSCQPLASALSLSFSGPMFLDFATGLQNGIVDVYVPYCPFHEAGFFFSTGSYSESDIYGCVAKNLNPSQTALREYRICSAGIPCRTVPPTAITAIGATQTPVTTTPTTSRATTARAADSSIYILSIDGITKGVARSGPPPTLHKRLFKVTVPMPRYIGALYSDIVEVVPSLRNPTGNALTHCTSLRFFYEWDLTSPITLVTPEPVGDLTITPPVYCELPRFSEIELRYEGIGLEDDNDPHSDARSCFASLAALSGTQWWLYYEDGRTSPTNTFFPNQGFSGDPLPRDPCADFSSKHRRIELKTGADCHSPVVTTGLSLPGL